MEAARPAQGGEMPVQASTESSTTRTAPQHPAASIPGNLSVDSLLQRIHARQWWTNLWLAVLAVPLALTLSLVCLSLIVPMVVAMSEEYLSGARDTAELMPPPASGMPSTSTEMPLPTFVEPKPNATLEPYATPAASAPAKLAPSLSPSPTPESNRGK